MNPLPHHPCIPGAYGNWLACRALGYIPRPDSSELDLNRQFWPATNFGYTRRRQLERDLCIAEMEQVAALPRSRPLRPDGDAVCRAEQRLDRFISYQYNAWSLLEKAKS